MCSQTRTMENQNQFLENEDTETIYDVEKRSE